MKNGAALYTMIKSFMSFCYWSAHNSIVYKAIQEEYGSFSNYIWSFTDNNVVMEEFTERTAFPLSDTISKDLKKRGMTFVGSTILYPFLQSMGIINGHSKNCICYLSK